MEALLKQTRSTSQQEPNLCAPLDLPSKMFVTYGTKYTEPDEIYETNLFNQTYKTKSTKPILGKLNLKDIKSNFHINLS